MSTNALRQLATDVMNNHACRCYVDDLPEYESCPCEGDGRDDDGYPTWDGCFHCQARAALANDSSNPAPAATPNPPNPPAAGAAHVETGGPKE